MALKLQDKNGVIAKVPSLKEVNERFVKRASIRTSKGPDGQTDVREILTGITAVVTGPGTIQLEQHKSNIDNDTNRAAGMLINTLGIKVSQDQTTGQITMECESADMDFAASATATNNSITQFTPAETDWTA